MDKFWELLGQSVIFQGLLVTGLAGVACYLWATGQPVPEMLSNLLMVIVGFFFGAKVQQASNSAVERMKQNK